MHEIIIDIIHQKIKILHTDYGELLMSETNNKTQSRENNQDTVPLKKQTRREVNTGQSIHDEEDMSIPMPTENNGNNNYSNNNTGRYNSERKKGRVHNNHQSSPHSSHKKKFPRNNNKQEEEKERVIREKPESLKDVMSIYHDKLAAMSMMDLRALAIDIDVESENIAILKKQEIIFEILNCYISYDIEVNARGTLEIMTDSYGFLRAAENSYLPGPGDIYVAPHHIKRFNLKTGDMVEGIIRIPREGERFFALKEIKKVNFDPIEIAQTRLPFDTLTPLFPDERLNLETKSGDVSTRMINICSPVGKGQRGLLVAPPRTGKTVLLQKIANAITENHPEVYLIVLLIDERPEEVTDMQRNVKAEVIASTFDEQANRHVQVADMVIEKARRLVEHGRDVVILLDSITRLARAYNQTIPASGKILSGGVDSNALHKPKRFFGAARNIEGGGSLTIIATALVETGSRMDEVIFEEFKGTGNMEVILDRRIADRRIFPAINVKKSGTRREDLLLDKDEIQKMYVLRKIIGTMEDIEVADLIVERVSKTKTNVDFFASMKQ